MRIVCDSCGAKYSIADEKVIGKVFKVRCKKCSHVIMVDGTSGPPAGAEEEEATRVYDPTASQEQAAAEPGAEGGDEAADGAVWYVVIEGDQTIHLVDKKTKLRSDLRI